MRKYIIYLINLLKFLCNFIIDIKFRFFNKEIDVNTSNGKIRLKAHNLIEYKLFAKHEENKLLNMLSDKMNDKDIVYDVGAHAGYHSLYLASTTKNGQVYAFEPNPNCFAYLKENIDLNPKLNIIPINSAISDSVGKVKLSYGKAYDPSARVGVFNYSSINDIDSTTIDDFAKIHETPTIIKIDVEGFEDRVISGAQNTLKVQKPRIIMIELHPEMIEGGNYSIVKIRKTIENNDYREMYNESRRNQIHIIYERI